MSGRRAVAGGIGVRGTCRAGHVTEATSDPGRVSWEGPCAHDGCELRVKAFRPRGAPPPTPAPVAPAPPADDKPRRLRRVDYDAKPRKRDQPDDTAGPASGGDDPGSAGGAPAAAKPARRPVHRQPSPAATDEPGRGDEPDHRSVSERRSIRERITGRRTAEADRPRSSREFRLPY